MIDRWLIFKRWLPASVFVLFIVTSQLVAFHLLLTQPWTGLRLQPDPESGFLRVTKVISGSPAEEIIKTGTILTALQGENLHIPLTTDLLMFPFLSHAPAKHTLYQASFDDVRYILEQETLPIFQGRNGERYVIAPMQKTPFSALPPDFWLFIGLFTFVPAACLTVWWNKPLTWETGCLLIAGAAYYAFFLALAVRTSKEVSLGAWESSIANVQWLTLCVFMLTLLLLALLHPHQLLKHRLTKWLLLATACIGLNAFFSWLPFILHDSFILQYLVLLAGLLMVAHMQVRKTFGQPLEYAAARMEQLALMPLFFIFFLFALPVSLQMTPLISYWFLYLLASTVFIGLALALLRYRLHDMEYGWFQLWLWLSGGSIVILFTILLIWPFGLPNTYAMGIAMVLAGFLYFPLRSWLYQRLLPLDNQTLNEFLPLFSAAVSQAKTQQAFDDSLEAALRKRFSPQTLRKWRAELEAAEVTEGGVSLWVPAVQPGYAYQLSGKQNAARLFSGIDITAVESLHGIARMAFNASETRQQAVLAERERLLHEMRHTIGKRLQTLAEELPKPHHRAAARETLQTLDETVRLSLPSTSLQLMDHLATWETETRQRAQAAETSLNWRADRRLADKELSPRQALELMQFVREAVSNALKHANPTYLLVDFTRRDEHIHIQISHNGDIKPPETWCAGTGLRSMEARINALNGEWGIQPLPDQQGISINAKVPL